MSFLDKLKTRLIKFFRKQKFSGKSSKVIFETIYRENLWGSDETVSGPGSKINSTKNLQKDLAELIQKYGFKSIVDCGCGDFNWMQQVDLQNTHYIGIDVVTDLIEKNKIKYQNALTDFQEKNIIEDSLPKADLFICRDVLVHLNNDQIKKAIRNFIHSQSNYFLITSFTEIENKNTFTGDWRPINLQAAPFNFPAPIETISEIIFSENLQVKKQMCLWKRELLENIF